MSAYEYQEKPTLTPRTDAAEQFDYVTADFARTPERELATITSERNALLLDIESAVDLLDGEGGSDSELCRKIRQALDAIAAERDALRAELDHIRAECVETGITPPSMTDTQAFHGELSLLTNCATDGRNWRAMLQRLADERDALRADKERLDWLETEMERDNTRALFRQNMPITRAAIDAARKEQP